MHGIHAHALPCSAMRPRPCTDIRFLFVGTAGGPMPEAVHAEHDSVECSTMLMMWRYAKWHWLTQLDLNVLV